MSGLRVQGGWAQKHPDSHLPQTSTSRAQRLAELGQEFPALDATVIAMLYDELHMDETLLATRLAEMQKESEDSQRFSRIAALRTRFPDVGDDVIALVIDEYSGDAERAEHDLEQLSHAGHADDELARLQRHWGSAVDSTLIAMLWEECEGDVAQVTELLRAITHKDVTQAPASGGKLEADKDDNTTVSSEAVSFLQGVFPQMDASFLGSLVHACDGDAQSALATLLPLLDEDADNCNEDSGADTIPSLQELADQFPGEDSGSLESLRALLELLPGHDPSHGLRAIRASKGNLEVALEVILSRAEKGNGLPSGSMQPPRPRRSRGRGRVRVVHAPGAPSLAQDAWRGPISAAEKLALREMFPSVDRSLLEEVHASTRSLEETVRQMREVYGVEARIRPEVNPGGETDVMRSVAPLQSHINSTQLAELEGKTRSELLTFGHQEAARRNRCYALAAEALRDGDAEAARSLRQQAHEHDARVHAAQTLAALHVTQGVPDATNAEHDACREVASGVYEVDLHGFLVKEALQVLDSMLHRLSQNPHARLLKVITGAGYHSGPRGPRIKPAVLAYLRARALPHYALNAGAYLVQLPKGWYRL